MGFLPPPMLPTNVYFFIHYCVWVGVIGRKKCGFFFAFTKDIGRKKNMLTKKERIFFFN